MPNYVSHLELVLGYESGGLGWADLEKLKPRSIHLWDKTKTEYYAILYTIISSALKPW